MSSIVSDALKQARAFVNSAVSASFTYKNNIHFNAVPDYSTKETDMLKYPGNILAKGWMKLEVEQSVFPTAPKVGEYIYQGSMRYSIVGIQDRGEPHNTYLIDCAGVK